MLKAKTLEQWRHVIKREADFVGIRPYSHNIITIALNTIALRFGDDEANKAIRDFGLEEKGWKEKK